jgi:hypothetical protein
MILFAQQYDRDRRLCHQKFNVLIKKIIPIIIIMQPGIFGITSGIRDIWTGTMAIGM